MYICIHLVLQNSVWCFKYILKQSFLATPNAENKFWTPEHLKVPVNEGIMVGGLTVFGNRALMLTLWKKTPSTYTFSESLIVIEYNHIFEIF